MKGWGKACTAILRTQCEELRKLIERRTTCDADREPAPDDEIYNLAMAIAYQVRAAKWSNQ